MLKLAAGRKNRIDLGDYPVEQDIENRLLMSHFSVFDVEVLEEILLSSLVTPIPRLANSLEASADDVVEVVDRLSQTGLLKRIGDVIHVDKEMRKYYEFQILKFDDEFEPNIDFLQGLLRKVPIHALPLWYAVPRTSSNIFESIVDKYLRTPRLYQRYLLELQFEDPVLQHIMEDVFNSPDLKVRSRELRDRYQLSRPAFEKHMLLLEFSFVCCLSYNRIGDQWKEVVTPFQEWGDLLRFRRETIPTSIGDESQIQKGRDIAFGFASDSRVALQRLESGPLPLDSESDKPRLTGQALTELLQLCDRLPASTNDLKSHPDYFSWVVEKLCLLGLAENEEGALTATEAGSEWLSLSLQDSALSFYRHSENRLIYSNFTEDLQSEKNYREVEKAVSRVAHIGWVDFEGFLRGVTAPIGSSEEISLQKVGRRWSYVRPSYNPEEKLFIKAVIFELFVEAGFVITGTHCGCSCFKVTDFGREILSSTVE